LGKNVSSDKTKLQQDVFLRESEASAITCFCLCESNNASEEIGLTLAHMKVWSETEITLI